MSDADAPGTGRPAGGEPRDTATLLTPPGGAAIAVVRLAGRGVGAFLAAHFSKRVTAGRCVHGTLSDGERVIDDPVVVIDGTGGIADVNLHGGPWVVQAVLELARRSGFDSVGRPGLPMPDDAADGDDPLSREVVRYLPMARTELAVRVLLAQAEAWAAAFGGGRTPAAETVREILADRSLHHLLHPPRVAVVGAPNVGKSTLANRLFAQERSITADLPGTTRDWVGEIANVDGLAVVLVDTPGLRDTPDPIEAEAISRAKVEAGRADFIVAVLDPTQPPGPQRALAAGYPGAVHVVNKSDLDGPRDSFADLAPLRIVATTGAGVDGLRAQIKRRFLGPEPFDVRRLRCWTSRQRALLEDTKKGVDAARPT